MTAIVHSTFGGIAPLISPRKLGDSFAQVAENVRLESGSLVPLKGLAAVTDEQGTRLLGTTGMDSFYRYEGAGNGWLWDVGQDCSRVKIPALNDPYKRVAEARRAVVDGVSYPTLRAVVESGMEVYPLGIPAPTTQPVVDVPAIPEGTSDLNIEYVSYIYSYVDRFGYEGPPSSPTRPVAHLRASNTASDLIDAAKIVKGFDNVGDATFWHPIIVKGAPEEIWTATAVTAASTDIETSGNNIGNIRISEVAFVYPTATQITEMWDITCIETEGGNHGTGTVTSIVPTEDTVAEIWTLVCTTAGTSAVFSVTGDVHGAVDDATVNVSYPGDYLGFRITPGDYALGDAFTLVFTGAGTSATHTLTSGRGVYSVVGGVSGAQPNATVGAVYSNNIITFKLDVPSGAGWVRPAKGDIFRIAAAGPKVVDLLLDDGPIDSRGPQYIRATGAALVGDWKIEFETDTHKQKYFPEYKAPGETVFTWLGVKGICHSPGEVSGVEIYFGDAHYTGVYTFSVIGNSIHVAQIGPSVWQVVGSASGTVDHYAYSFKPFTASGVTFTIKEGNLQSDVGDVISVNTVTAVGEATLTFSGEYPPEYPQLEGGKIRIYRSNTGTQETAFQFCMDQPITTTTCTDGVIDSDLQEVCPSFTWIGPPNTVLEPDLYTVDMQKIIHMGRNTFVGYADRTICFSEPFLPHAWPADYRINVKHPIVDIQPMKDGIIVLTTAAPVLVMGAHPSAMAQVALSERYGCVSARSAVDMGGTTFYASNEGLMSIDPSGVINLTEKLMSWAQWKSLFFPDTIVAFQIEGRYIGCYDNGTERKTFIFDPRNGVNALTTCTEFFTNVFVDHEGDGTVYIKQDGADTTPPTDPYRNQVVLDLDMNLPAGTTTMHCAVSGRLFTCHGDAAISSAHQNGGYNALRIPAAGTGYLAAATDESFSLGMDDFTIDVEVLLPSSPHNFFVFDSLPLLDDGHRFHAFLLFFEQGDLKLFTQGWSKSFACPLPGAGTWNYGDWIHVRFTIYHPEPLYHPDWVVAAASIENVPGTYQYGWNGHVENWDLTANDMAGTQYPPTGAGGLNIGCAADNPTYVYSDEGYLRKLRITRGVARNNDDYMLSVAPPAPYSVLETSSVPISAWEKGSDLTYRWKSGIDVSPRAMCPSAVYIEAEGTPTVKLYGDGQLRATKSIPAGTPQLVRLPAGYRAVDFEVEVSGTSPFDLVMFGDSVSELGAKKGGG